MNATMIILIILTLVCVFMFILSVFWGDNKNKEDSTLILLFGFLMAFCFGALMYCVGVGKGAEKTAKGKYEIFYKADKDGIVTDTIVDWKL